MHDNGPIGRVTSSVAELAPAMRDAERLDGLRAAQIGLSDLQRVKELVARLEHELVPLVDVEVAVEQRGRDVAGGVSDLVHDEGQALQLLLELEHAVKGIRRRFHRRDLDRWLRRDAA